ncbi:MAG: hypothetical protein HC868_14215 [Sphingomonadales bacterium]|nr:hypothetical protein [Sphingomonadales bacterium]
MPARRHYPGIALLLMLGTGAIVAASALVLAQDRSHMDYAQHGHGNESVVPTMPGQDAFGTIQEIVRILDADPDTDWSKVNIEIGYAVGGAGETEYEPDQPGREARAMDNLAPTSAGSAPAHERRIATKREVAFVM